MELEMLYLVFLSEMMKKKPIFELKTLKFFIVYSFHKQMFQFQGSTSRFQASCLSIRF